MHESLLCGDAEAQRILRAAEAQQEVPTILADLVATILHQHVADEGAGHAHYRLGPCNAPGIDILHTGNRLQCLNLLRN